jgi:hypothetical protein
MLNILSNFVNLSCIGPVAHLAVAKQQVRIATSFMQMIMGSEMFL